MPIIRDVITRWKTETKDLEKGNEQAVKNTTTSVNKIDKVFKRAAVSIGAFVTAGAALQVFNDAVRTIREFEQQLSTLSSITGLQGKAIEELGDKAIQISGRFGTSASEIVDGFSLVGSAIPELLGAPDALAEITAQADILAKASGLTLEEAIGALTKSLNQFGAGAESAAMFADILATSQQKGTARIDQLSLAFKNVGSIANAANLSFETTNALLQALAKGGLEGAEAGTKLRGIISRLSSSGRKELNPALTDINKVLDTLGKEITDVESATKFFGEQNAAAALTLIKQKGVVEDLNGALGETGNALAQATTNTDNLNGMLQKSAGLWDAFVLSVVDGEGIISNGAKRMVQAFNGILGALISINDGSAEFATNFSDIFSEIGRAESRLNAARDALKGFIGDRDSVTGLELEIELLKARNELAQQGLNQNLSSPREDGDEEKRLADIAFFRSEIAQTTAQQAAAQNQLNFLLGIEKATTEDIIESVQTLSEKEKKARADAAAKRLKEQQAAQKKIEDLRLSLLEDGFEKERLILIAEAKRKIEAAKGTEEQIAEQRFFITVATLKKIQKLEEDQLKQRREFESKLRKMAASDDAEREQTALDKIILGFERKRQDEIIKLKQKRNDGEFKNEEDFQTALRQLEIDSIKERLQSGVDELDERRALQEQLLDLEDEKNQALIDKDERTAEQRRQIIQDLAQIAFSVGNELLQNQVDQIDKAIALQKERVSEATADAENGNAEQLQLEEQRLKDLQKAREKAVRQQRVLAAAEIATNSAIAVSSAIPAVIRGFSEGGLIGGIAQAVALAATVASSVIAVKGALSNVPAFAEGTEFFNGKGSGTSDSNLALISRGERIVPASENAKLNGISNDVLADYALAGKALHNGRLSNGVYGSSATNNKGVEKRLERVESAINNLSLSTRATGGDLETVLSKRNKLKERRRRRMK